MQGSRTTISNPLRISQESLDLDDIISDLNSEVGGLGQATQGNEGLAIEGLLMKTAQVTSTASKAVAANKNVQSATSAKQLTEKAQRTQKPKGANKENDSLQVNRHAKQLESVPQTAQKSQIAVAHGTTTETKAQSSSSMQQSEHKPNQRYATESDLFSIPQEIESEDHSQLRQPFYLKNASTLQAANADEDVESFQRKLDTLLVNFRSETLSEFMRTKKQVLQDQSQVIDAERRRCNTLIGVKQNEIEQLKEGLAAKTKLAEDLQTRCEAMSFWSGKSKTLLRIKLLQHRAFSALKDYRDFKKHSKRVLENRLRQYRENIKRSVFLGWEAQHRQWKVKKNRDDFEKAVKLELQNICAQYNKEIESLRDKLSDANAFVENEQRNRSLMQENLKKAFMRGVCALNFEAMNILHPSDAAGQIEREMERQVAQAMGQTSGGFSDMSLPSQRSTFSHQPLMNVALSPRSELSSQNDISNTEQPEMQTQNPFISLVSQPLDHDYKRVDSKDTQWKPAPVMGTIRPTGSVVPTFTYAQPSITSQLKSALQLQAPVLPTTFKSMQSDSIQVVSNPHNSNQLMRLEEDTTQRVVNANPNVINNATSLPDFVRNGGQEAGQGGKTIVVPQNQRSAPKSAAVTSTQAIMNGKKSTPATAVTSAAGSKKK